MLTKQELVLLLSKCDDDDIGAMLENVARELKVKAKGGHIISVPSAEILKRSDDSWRPQLGSIRLCSSHARSRFKTLSTDFSETALHEKDTFGINWD
ncbi:hypothetical protein QJS10_CPB20g02009 [Acorus calamus]|uniref:Uncharacterized protein n=1 Tax=Acorus calamus TaxID=4465 RepID=A0AAV9CB50_ACOCL|nr:hypothetical protein QJS10_CPB20g02009 [Acorus calamus]